MTPPPDALVAMLPHPLTQQLSAHGHTPEHVRDQLAAIGRGTPETGHVIADQLAVCALQAIAAGHHDPQRLAADTLTVLSASFERWYG